MMKDKIWNLTKNQAKSDLFCQIVPITLILLLATGLYIYQIGAESLWKD